MDTKDIQLRIEALNSKIAECGFAVPDCQFHIHADRFWAMLQGADPNGGYADRLSEYIAGDSVEQVLERAELFHIPNLEEKTKQDFVKALGKLIDKGRDIGIDVDFINPLEVSMRKLSENILTSQG